MYEKLDVLTTLLKTAEQLNDNNIRYLPDEHKNTSLDVGARCDLSYHQGYRDGIQSLLSIIQTLYDDAYHEMEEDTDRMYLEHLRERCVATAKETADNESTTDINEKMRKMNKEECIAFLKDKKVWLEFCFETRKIKELRNKLTNERELEMIDK